MNNPLDQLNQQVAQHYQNTGSYVLPQAQPKPQTGLNPKAWISEIAGTAGMVGGGLLGGPVGAAAGGALLGGLGKVLEQKVQGQNVNLGQVAQEAGTNALFGYGPLRAVGKVTGITVPKILSATGLKASEGAISGAITKPAIKNEAVNLIGQATGIHPAIKVSGEPLGADAAKLQDFLFKKVLPGKTSTTASAALNATDEFANKTGAKIGDILTNQATTFDKPKLLADIANRFENVYGPTWKDNRVANLIYSNVEKSANTNDLWKAQKGAENYINYMANSSAAVADRALLGSQARDAIKTTLTSVHKDLKPLLSDYSNAKQVIGLTANATKNLKGLDVLGLKIGGRPLQKGKAFIGNAMQGVENAPITGAEMAPVTGAEQLGRTAPSGALLPMRPTGPVAPLSLTDRLIAGGAGRQGQLRNILPGNQPALQQTIAANLPQLPSAIRGGIKREIGAGIYGDAQQVISPSDQSQPGVGTQLLNQVTQPSENPIYNLTSLKNDITRDPKNTDKYLKLYETMQKTFGTSGKQLSGTQAFKAASAANALNDIPIIIEAIKSNKFGVQQAIPGAQSPIGQRILGTSNLQSAMFNIVDNILRARSGAATPESEIKRYYNRLIPNPLDSKQAQLDKMYRLIREMQGYVNPPATSSSATLQDALIQAQQGGY